MFSPLTAFNFRHKSDFEMSGGPCPSCLHFPSSCSGGGAPGAAPETWHGQQEGRGQRGALGATALVAAAGSHRRGGGGSGSTCWGPAGFAAPSGSAAVLAKHREPWL